MRAGRPGFGRSYNPAIPLAAYRFFHAMTVGFDTPTRDAISLVPTPSATSNTIRARKVKLLTSRNTRTLQAACV